MACHPSTGGQLNEHSKAELAQVLTVHGLLWVGCDRSENTTYGRAFPAGEGGARQHGRKTAANVGMSLKQ
jgi:hypothetical protein